MVSGVCAILDPAALVLALRELGFVPRIYAAPCHLIGYEGDAAMKKRGRRAERIKDADGREKVRVWA